MADKNADHRRPSPQKQRPAGKISLDHGVSSLVAQDSPDDSQLGAPEAGRARTEKRP